MRKAVQFWLPGLLTFLIASDGDGGDRSREANSWRASAAECETSYSASVRKALREQRDLTRNGEHCSADTDRLATIGRAVGHQVRVYRNDCEYALFTVSEVRNEDPDTVVRMGKGGRARLGMSEVFAARVCASVPHPTFSDADAKATGEFVERLNDDGRHSGLIVIAPHGGDIEPYTAEQADRVVSQLSGKSISSWLCKGWSPRKGGTAFERWHITSSDIHEASFPLLQKVIGRGYAHAVSFHCFDNDAQKILIGGAGPPGL